MSERFEAKRFKISQAGFELFLLGRALTFVH
jgi:hypothetical protein